MKKLLVASIAALALASCGKTVNNDPPVVKVPVPQPCVVNKPTKNKELAELIEPKKWCTRKDREAGKCSGLDVGQKAEEAVAHVLEDKNYTGELEIATGQCLEIK